MNETDFIRLVTTKSAKRVLKALADLSEEDRRKLAPTALKVQKRQQKAAWDVRFNGLKPPVDLAKDLEALGVAVLATARPSEYSCGDWRILPSSIPLEEVFAVLNPSWMNAWAEAAVEDNPRLITTIHALVNKGLCTIPKTDAYILGYYAGQAGIPELARTQFLAEDVWRFFEVEGGGDLSLAACDKYCGRNVSWANLLIELSRDGTLDRQRLLDASLDALERDFGQFRAGWYSRFHVAMDPTEDEIANRANRYLDLLSSPVPPTVAFALKFLKRMDTNGGVDPTLLVTSIEPALQSRQKSSAKLAIRLLKSSAKRHPQSMRDVAKVAVSALISEAGEVQALALDLVEELDQVKDAEIQSRMRDYLELAAPTVQTRLAAHLQDAPVQTNETLYPTPVLEDVVPVASAEEAVETFLALLEHCDDAVLTERALDGMARYGASAEPLLNPLAKRANQLRARGIDAGLESRSHLQIPIAATALAWARCSDFVAEIEPSLQPRYSGHIPLGTDPNSFVGMFSARSAELLAFVQAGLSVPMLSAPTDNRGYLAPQQLIQRMDEYRQKKLVPGQADFKLALMRLAPEDREAALLDFTPETEEERALAYAMGADHIPEKDPQLWALAWASRLPCRPDPAVQKLVGNSIPGAGVPAIYTFHAEIRRIDEFFWPMPRVDISPEIPKHLPRELGFAVPAKLAHTYLGDPGVSWFTHPSPWVGLLRPSQSELFFLSGIFELELDQKLTNHFCLMFLDPFFRPGLNTGPMSHAMLAWYLASADEGIGTSSVDALATIIAQRMFSPTEFATAARQLVFFAALPLRRWTKRLAEVAGVSAQHGKAVRRALSWMLVDLPDDVPRDLGGLLELLHELCTASGTGLENTDTVVALNNIKVAGKTGKFAKKLVGFIGPID
ncbi:DUF6493 family protein [Ruegeria lacuscaerulensis]|uniref:DUF6493 family protein n=1 Tax=Ruegeria lacuscaerulensis TaxID=55218 RepID=UPI001480EB24|nr:DUF6493 family protein [Ruegeria lacuscaerulensis]